MSLERRVTLIGKIRGLKSWPLWFQIGGDRYSIRRKTIRRKNVLSLKQYSEVGDPKAETIVSNAISAIQWLGVMLVFSCGPEQQPAQQPVATDQPVDIPLDPQPTDPPPDTVDAGPMPTQAPPEKITVVLQWQNKSGCFTAEDAYAAGKSQCELSGGCMVGLCGVAATMLKSKAQTLSLNYLGCTTQTNSLGQLVIDCRGNCSCQSLGCARPYSDRQYCSCTAPKYTTGLPGACYWNPP